MLSIGAMAGGQGAYYSGLAREDYYLEGGEPPGKWWGRGAEALRLAGTVRAEDLTRIFDGFSSAGKPLVRNAGDVNHRAGWDLTFSAPKSVSVLWSQADAATRREIQAAHRAGVIAALSYLQDDVAYGRRGKAGHDRIAAGLVVATFEHGTSRALDPQLHTHCLVMNLAVLPDGTTKSLFSKPIYGNKMTGGALYRAQLASELGRRLGIHCDPKCDWFEVRGVPEKLCEVFSKRRAAIEKALGKLGLETASAAAFAALSTREGKELVPPREKLFESWQKVGHEYGFTREHVDALLAPEKSKRPDKDALAVIKRATEVITEQNSHFTQSELLTVTAKLAQTHDVRTIRNSVSDAVKDPTRLVFVGQLRNERRYTTPEMLALEKRLLQAAKNLCEAKKHGLSSTIVENIIAKYSTPRLPVLEEVKHHVTQIARAARGHKTETVDRDPIRKFAPAVLTAEQAAAVRHLTEASGRIALLSGVAGSGKTFTLQACREAWEKAGYKVLGAAFSAKAANELQTGSRIKSDTLTMLEMRMNPALSYELKHHGKQLLRAAMNKPTYKLQHLKIDSKTVLVVDEAGMVGTRQMARLVEAVEKGGGKLVLVGDAKQLQPISAGAPFKSLVDRQGCAELTHITRQKDERDREVVRAFARGDADSALQSLASRGLVHVEKDRERAMEKLVSDWAKLHGREPQEALIFVGKNADADGINRSCQWERAEAGYVNTSRRVRLDQGFAFEGDRVLLTKNSRTLGVQNGTLGTIVAAQSLRNTLVVQTDAGTRVVIPLSDYKHDRGPKKGEIAVRLGYAVTTHKGQGSTVDHAYVLAGGFMQDREISYVQASRARYETRIYTDERQAGRGLTELARKMSESRAKSLAHDVSQLSQDERRRHPEISMGR